MTAQLIWRKTEKLIALMEWSGIELKSDLPYEYVLADGPKFWYVPPTTIDYTHYGEFIQLDEHAGKALDSNTFPSRLYVGTVLTHHEHDMLKEYLTLAGVRLSRIKAEVEISSRVVDAI